MLKVNQSGAELFPHNVDLISRQSSGPAVGDRLENVINNAAVSFKNLTLLRGKLLAEISFDPNQLVGFWTIPGHRRLPEKDDEGEECDETERVFEFHSGDALTTLWLCHQDSDQRATITARKLLSLRRDAFHRVPISGNARRELFFLRHGVISLRSCRQRRQNGRSGIRPYQLVNAGKITSYVGGCDYFLEKTGALDDERAALTAG